MERSGARQRDDRRPGLVLDTGALLAVEIGQLTSVLGEADRLGLPIRIPAGAVAQAWRGGPRSARLAALLKRGIVVVPLDEMEARRVGELIRRRRRGRHEARPDVVDAHAALVALSTRSLVYTSDAADIASYGVELALIRAI